MRYLVVVLLLSAGSVTGQVDTSQVPVWVDMMKDPNVKLNQVSRAFELYWENRPITPGSGYKPFKRWEYHMSRLVDDNGNLPAPGHVFNTMSAYNYLRSTSGNWRPLGPNFNQTTELGDISGVGRINAIAFHPTDPNTIYAGAPQGGLWRTTDNGNSWEVLTDQLPSLGVSAILIDPNNPSIIYIGTGDRDGNDAFGVGVFKSTDNGQTWNQSNSGMGDKIVCEMRFHPDSSNIIIAAASDGVYRTTDSGATWTKTTIITHYYEDVEINPADPNIVMVTGACRLYRSTDNGLTWNIIPGLAASNRMFITVTPDDPNRVYALVTNQRSFHSFYRSDDGGLSFTQVSNSPNIMGYNLLGNDSGGQSWYDATVCADPNNADVVYVGGIHIFKSYDGGINWAHNSPNVHSDQHYITFSPLTDEIYMGNDGGVYRSDAGNNQWEDISANISVGQIYKIGQSATNVNKVLTGFQDNGTGYFNGVGWSRVIGADGMECQVDQFDENYLYGSVYYGSIRRSTNNGASFQRIAAENENGITEEGAWVTPFTLAENDNNVMYAGYVNAWRTTNIKAPDNDDVLWEKISNGLNGSDECSVIEHSQADNDILYLAKGTNTFCRSDNCNDIAASVTWNIYTSGMIHGGSINDIEAHPTDPNVVYMVKGNGVVKSTNKGQNWTDITLNLPAVTKNCIVFDTTTAEGLYVGTESGVFYKDSGMANWEYFGTGLAAASSITELEIYYGTGGNTKRVRASTYGRGLWESDGYGVTTYNYPSTPVFTFADDNPKKRVRGTFDMNVGFYKNLSHIDVIGFNQSMIAASNATISNFSGGPSDFSFTVEPTSPGIITLYIPGSVVSDSDGIDNLESEFFEIYYDEDIPRLGFEGPGGVGTHSQLAIWLDPQNGLLKPDGTKANVTGDSIVGWLDKSAQNILVEQTNLTRTPFYVSAADGISGLPAMEVDVDTSDTGDYLIARDVRPGSNFAGFSVFATEGNYFTDNGWMASARGKSGFVMHPTNNSRNFYVSVMDENESYWSGYSILVEQPENPHVYAFTYCENPVGRFQYASMDGNSVFKKTDAGINRSDSALLDVRYGWDYNERWAEGKFGEHFIYNTELGMSHYKIVRNYLGAKYQVYLGANDLYAFDNDYRFNLAGIGQVAADDYHYDAQGTGIVRMTSSSMSDNSFLLWADDTASTDVWIINKTPFLSSRVQRTWRVDETNSVGSVEVRIAKSHLPTATENYVLFTSPVKSFGSGLYAHEFVDLGDTLSVFVDFDDASFFTIGQASENDIKLINEEFSGLSITAYPSLSNGTFDLYVRNTNELDGVVTLYNMLGQVVWRNEISGGKTAVMHLASFLPGQYIAKFQGSDNSVATTRIVVMQ